MKKILFSALFFVLFALASNAQTAINTIFKQYAEDDKFTAVYISEYMFSLLSEVQVENQEDKAVLELLAGLKELHVLTTEQNGLKLFEEASKKLNTPAYKNLMSVRDKEENIRIFIKEDNKKITELLLLVGSSKEFVLLSLVGNIDLKKISKLAGTMDIKGLDYLKKVEEKDNK